MNRQPGLILLDKPAGITSFAALFPVKRALGSGKVGHAGTLDRFATGLLLLATGSYTRLLPWLTGCSKTYRATVLFGSETDTLDPEGKVIAEAAPPSYATLRAVLPAFKGTILQTPPLWSAIHIDGKRAYERALSGENPDMKPRSITIHDLRLDDYDGTTANMTVHCGSGTYIRSLARDIALAAGTRAHLVALQRCAIGEFTLETAVAPDSFDPEQDMHDFDPEKAGSLGLQVKIIADAHRSAFVNGVALPSSVLLPHPAYPDHQTETVDPSLGDDAAVYTTTGDCLGIVTLGAPRIRYRCVLGGAA